MADDYSAASLALRRRMAELSGTDPHDWYLVAKARQGMQAVFAAAGAATGRQEVLTQLFTCVTAVNPILCAGLMPRYGDVSPATLCLDPPLPVLGANTCVVVLQRTFGIECRRAFTSVRDEAYRAGALLLEDAAHSVGRLARNDKGIPLADVSVHSFGVEKMLFGTYFGGAVWVSPYMQDAGLRRALCDKLEALPSADATLDKAARAYRNQTRVVTRLPQAAAKVLRARWERRGVFEPAVSDAELRGSVNREPSLPSAWMCAQALAALNTLADNERNRAACVDAYRAELSGLVPTCDVHGQPLLRFPAYAVSEEKADEAISRIAGLGFYVPAWPRPLLVPGVTDPRPYGLADGLRACPTTRRLSKTVVALPTDIDPARVPDVVGAVRDLLVNPKELL